MKCLAPQDNLPVVMPCLRIFGPGTMRELPLSAISSLATVGWANGRTEVALPDAEIDHWSRKSVCAEWPALPPAEHATEHQAVTFAMKAMTRFSFRASGAPTNTSRGAYWTL